MTTWTNDNKTETPIYVALESNDLLLSEMGGIILSEDGHLPWGNSSKNVTSWNGVGLSSINFNFLIDSNYSFLIDASNQLIIGSGQHGWSSPIKN